MLGLFYLIETKPDHPHAQNVSFASVRSYL